MKYEPEKIRREFIAELKKAKVKSKEDIMKVVYKFILDRVLPESYENYEIQWKKTNNDIDA